MKRGLNIHINFTNRSLYTFVAFIVFLVIGVSVFAFGTSTPSTFGHSAGELDLSSGVNGNAVFNGNVVVGDRTDITPDFSGNGHLQIYGNGYTGFISQDLSAMYVGHNSASRRLDLMTDETTRLSIAAGGNVGIGTTNPTAKLHVVGKITATGGVDPPYVSFSSETHDTIREYAKDVEEHEVVMIFWNKDTKRMEVYVIEEDKFYAL